MTRGLHPDRLFPSDPIQRAVTRDIYGGVRDLPLVCTHTHVDPTLLAQDLAFPDPVSLLVSSDHYVIRILNAQGIRPGDVGVPHRNSDAPPAAPRDAWRTFAKHWHLFLGTPTRIWIDHQLSEVFGVTTPLSEATADKVYDEVATRLTEPAFRPRALYERFRIEALATTDPAHLPLVAHEALQQDPWPGRVIPTFRPDAVVELNSPGWARTVDQLGELTETDTGSYRGYVQALRRRRRDFKALGATATDHSPATPETRRLPDAEAERIYAAARRGDGGDDDAAGFSAHMLMVFAELSCEDGLVMQLHAGSVRNHDAALHEQYGPDMGADIPQPVNYVHGLAELLNAYGSVPGFTLIVYTLDESTYSRELAPLAAHYPALRIGAPWWFFDSPEGMRRQRAAVVETAGFFNGAGFNDDARCFTSIPARHDMARRVECGFLARLVAEHQLEVEDAYELARLWAHTQARTTYRLGG